MSETPSNNSPGPTTAPKPSNALGIIALVFAILAFLTGLVPFLGLLFALPALILAFIGLSRKAVSKGMPVTSLVLGGLAFLTNVVVIALLLLAATGVEDEADSAEAPEILESPASDSTSYGLASPSPSASFDTGAEQTVADETVAQANARDAAERYLGFAAFSRSGLIGQLEFEGYETADAEYAVDALDVDWAAQAVLKADDYLNFSAFSRSGLIDQLEFEGFTSQEAEFGVDGIEVDWFEQAAIKAQNYLDFSSFSRSRLIDQLEFEGFTSEQAAYGADAVGL